MPNWYSRVTFTNPILLLVFFQCGSAFKAKYCQRRDGYGGHINRWTIITEHIRGRANK